MDDLVYKLFSLLDKKGWKLATAESCTGGLIGATITAIAGSSEYFERGFITYSNDAKTELLDVNPITLKAFGAVSEQCARLMARGAYAHSLADIAISVTGIAGPGGGNESKPIGTVYIGLSTNDHAEVHKHIFKGERTSIREQATVATLQHTINYLETL